MSTQAYHFQSITQERKIKTMPTHLRSPFDVHFHVHLQIVGLIVSEKRKYSLSTHVYFSHSHRKSSVFDEHHRAFYSMSQVLWVGQQNLVPQQRAFITDTLMGEDVSWEGWKSISD